MGDKRVFVSYGGISDEKVTPRHSHAPIQQRLLEKMTIADGSIVDGSKIVQPTTGDGSKIVQLQYDEDRNLDRVIDKHLLYLAFVAPGIFFAKPRKLPSLLDGFFTRRGVQCVETELDMLNNLWAAIKLISTDSLSTNERVTVVGSINRSVECVHIDALLRVCGTVGMVPTLLRY